MADHPVVQTLQEGVLQTRWLAPGETGRFALAGWGEASATRVRDAGGVVFAWTLRGVTTDGVVELRELLVARGAECGSPRRGAALAMFTEALPPGGRDDEPDGYKLEVGFLKSDAEQTVARFRELCERLDLRPRDGWAELEETGEADLWFSQHDLVFVRMRSIAWVAMCERRSPLDALRITRLVLADLFWGGTVQRARILLEQGDSTCLPFPPHFPPFVVAVVASEQHLLEDYTSLDAVDDAGWDEVHVSEACRLYSRGLAETRRVRLLQAIRENTWSLARCARPGRVKQDAQPPREDEQDAYYAGDPVLQQVGYIPALEAAEYAFPPGGPHILGYEIDHIRRLLQAGALTDGSRLTAVRVVFPSREEAEREMRPLLDIGATVLYMQDGREHRLSDDET